MAVIIIIIIYGTTLVLTYLLSYIVSKLRLIGQIFASESGLPHFNLLAGGDSLPISPQMIYRQQILWPTFPLQKVVVFLQTLL